LLFFILFAELNDGKEGGCVSFGVIATIQAGFIMEKVRPMGDEQRQDSQDMRQWPE
jgi:hypothetical protein